MAITPKPQKGFVPPRVLVAYARLTNSVMRYDVPSDVFHFERRELHAVSEFNKRRIHTKGLDLNAIHLSGRIFGGAV